MRLSNVLERFSLVSGLEGKELSRYAPLCADAISRIKAGMKLPLESLGDEDVRRLEGCAAAMSFYKYTLCAPEGSVESFGAGALSIRLGKNPIERARMMLMEECRAVAHIVSFEDDFAFRGVRV